MIPLRDSTPSQHFPLVTVFLIALNLYIFYYESTLGIRIEDFIYMFGMTPAQFNQYQVPPLGYYPFFTSMFLHGSWMHVIGNMWILWLFGDNIEDHMGKGRFLLFYLLCGLAAGAAHCLINPLSTIPVVGASGAVAGVMGAYFILFRNAQILTFVPPFFLFNFPAWIYLGFWILTQFWCGLGESCGQIAFWAHIGGFAAGMLLYRFFLKKPQYQ